MNAKLRFIERNGKPAFAVVPIERWRQIVEALEDAEDEAVVRDYLDAKARGDAEELIPGDVVQAILGGANRVKVYREWRGLTQTALAKAAGIAPLYVSQIETGRRQPSIRVLRALGRALKLDWEDLVPPEPEPPHRAKSKARTKKR